MKIKTITVVIPTYNEEDNIPEIYRRINTVFEPYNRKYYLEILFIDNFSTDRSREIIIELSEKNRR